MLGGESIYGFFIGATLPPLIEILWADVKAVFASKNANDYSTTCSSTLTKSATPSKFEKDLRRNILLVDLSTV